MKREMGGGKEHEVPMHLIENSTISHAAHVTKNRHNRMVCSQEAKVTEKPGAHNPSVRFITKDPRTLPRANETLVPPVKVRAPQAQKNISLARNELSHMTSTAALAIPVKELGHSKTLLAKILHHLALPSTVQSPKTRTVAISYLILFLSE